MVASASAFLRIGLIQQLRRRRSRMVALEAATVAEAMRILAGGGIDMAIVDDALTVPPAGDRLVAMIERQPGRTLVIATHQQREVPPTWADRVRVIQGVIDGVLDMGAIARALPAALDEVAVDQDLRRAGPRNAPIVVDQAGRPLRGRPDIILVAASTGGPSALTALLRHLGPLRLPLVIAQHMPADQTAGFAQYLAAESGLQVIERGDGPLPPSAQVTVLHGGSDYRLTCGRAGQLRLVATAVAGNVFHPSADLLFGSAAEAGVSAIAVVLSGMGEDGARGAAAIAGQGGRVLVQDYLSCIVAGMPQATRAACPSAAVADVAEIAERLARWSRALIPRAAAMVGG